MADRPRTKKGRRKNPSGIMSRRDEAEHRKGHTFQKWKEKKKEKRPFFLFPQHSANLAIYMHKPGEKRAKGDVGRKERK